MIIKLDFDGVFSDCGKLKSEGAKKLYGIDIPPEKFKKEFIINGGILSSEQHRELQKHIYENMEIGMLMEPVSGVLECVPKLQNEGHEIGIVTSRNELSKIVAEEWLKMHKLKIPMIGVGKDADKTDACRGADVFVDDDLDKLEPLINIVPNLFLFRHGYNKHIILPKTIKETNNWEELYHQITGIKENRHTQTI